MILNPKTQLFWKVIRVEEEKVAVVTGSTDGGAGRSIALALAREGFNIVINNRGNKNSASETALLVQQHNIKALLSMQT